MSNLKAKFQTLFEIGEIIAILAAIFAIASHEMLYAIFFFAAAIYFELKARKGLK